MHILDIIRKKRDRRPLNRDEIVWFVEAYTNGDIPDYQAAALLMAIAINGMDDGETTDLTMAMAASGEQLDLHDSAEFVVDKHSSGGVGDKTTLIVQPIVAACGVPVGKMSGRGLGASGGTIDKLESFDGWRGEMDIAQFRAQLRESGLVLAGQSADLAPADGKLYALRDVTGTVSSIPLIAASIMSKKLASGADGIVLDVKVGNGSFMKSAEDAETLARLMVRIGQEAQRKVVALLANMSQPLGYAIGNALEVQEALALLNGATQPQDLYIHSLEVSAHMLVLAGRATTVADGREMAAQALANGSALAKFRAMLAAQGGNVAQVDDPALLAEATLVEPITATDSGYVAEMDTGAIGWAAVNLGAGRRKKGEPVDHAVGFVLPVKVGQYVEAGAMLGTLYANDTEQADIAHDAVLKAIRFSAEPVEPLPPFLGTIS